MKKIFLVALMLVISVGVYAQQTLIKGSEKVSLYSPTDKVGFGTDNPSEKLTLKSLAGETPLGLIGYSRQTNPYIKLLTSAGVDLFKLFATTDYWSIGSSDSTLAYMVVKQSRSWIRFNRHVKASSITADSTTISKFLKLTPTTTPAAAIGRVYMKASDSCLYYYNGALWKKISVQ